MYRYLLSFILIIFNQFAAADQKFSCVGSTPEFKFRLNIIQENEPAYGNAKFYATSIANDQTAYWEGVVLKYDLNYISDGYYYDIVNGPELSAKQNLNLRGFQIINYQHPSLYRVKSSAQYYWKLDGGFKCNPPVHSMPGGCGPTFVTGSPDGGISLTKLNCQKM